MTRAPTAGLACSLLIAALAWGTASARAPTDPAPLPFLESWADTGRITVDDDWSGVTGVVGYRGDGLGAEPGTDPRSVTADGSGTPFDVAANRTDPRAVGLAAGVAEFELADPVVAIQGSATASAPHLVMSLDTRGRAGVTVRLTLRDIDATANNAVEPVALQWRVGAAGEFATLPGGYVADATKGPGEATQVTRVSVNLPATADGQALVQVRVITTNAPGQDEWIGIDDIEITAARATGGAPGVCPRPGPAPLPAPGAAPTPGPGPGPQPAPRPAPRPPIEAPELTGLELAPATFLPAKRGPAIVRRGRAGAALRFRLSRPALVRFEVAPTGGAPEDRAPKVDGGRLGPGVDGWRLAPSPREPSLGGRFTVRGRRGLNRLRFSGRVRGRALAAGAYVLSAAAVDRGGRKSATKAVRFWIGRGEED
ncbi:MAG TPA: hypothetical protein VF056_15700 [Thermoleophilaceae bacterium]